MRYTHYENYNIGPNQIISFYQEELVKTYKFINIMLFTSQNKYILI